jgi:5'-3' exonuclease
MILVDLNQVMISNMMVQIGNHQNAQVDENMIRHMVLNSLRYNRQKFHAEYGEFIICCDDKNYWRRSYFPYYKASRKKAREKSEMNWNEIFAALNNVREELKTFFPYKVIQVDTAEADDIIGTIVHKEGTPLNTGEPILILSGDKDYIQLHRYANVSQYDPTRKRFIKHSDPDRYLFEHIIKGDAGDGVPNVLSADNSFVVGERQKPVTKKRLEAFEDINNLDETLKRNWSRNQKLIDLTEVPESIKEQILEKYEEETANDRSHLFNYFIKNKLKYLMENISDF